MCVDESGADKAVVHYHLVRGLPLDAVGGGGSCGAGAVGQLLEPRDASVHDAEERERQDLEVTQGERVHERRKVKCWRWLSARELEPSGSHGGSEVCY